MADQVPPTVTHCLPGAGKRGRGPRTGFKDTYSFDTLMDDAVAMVMLHLPQIEEWQARELACDLQVGTRESRYWVSR